MHAISFLSNKNEHEVRDIDQAPVETLPTSQDSTKPHVNLYLKNVYYYVYLEKDVIMAVIVGVEIFSDQNQTSIRSAAR